MTAATLERPRVVKTDLVDAAIEVMDSAGIDLAKQLDSASDVELKYSTNDTGGSAMSTTMSVHELVDHVRWLIMNPGFKDTTPIYVGPSGIGKTFAIRQGAEQAARAMGRELNMIEKHVSLMGPTDLGGIPRPETKTKVVEGMNVEFGTKRTEFLPPSDIPMQSAFPEHAAAFAQFNQDYIANGRPNWSIMRDHPLHVFFLDEFTNPSMPAVIHQCFPIIYGKHISNMPLLQDTQVILAGNRPQDGTNSIALPRSATLRLNTIEVVPSLSGWFKHWAFKIEEVPVKWDKTKDGYVITEWERRPQIHPIIIAYLNQNSGRFAPNLMKIPTGQPAPSPRTWNSVSTVLYAYLNPVDGQPQVSEEMLFATVAGFIGQAEALQFWAYRKFAKDLPDVRRMLNSDDVPRSSDPKDRVPYGWLPSSFPKSMDTQVMMATQMVPLVTKENARRFMRFLLDGDMLLPEVSAMTMKLLRAMGIVETVAHVWARAEFTEWAAKYRQLIF